MHLTDPDQKVNHSNKSIITKHLQVEAAKQPTIAIIVGQYYEKTAVDAMMTNRQTFVRYATVGGLATMDSFSCVVIFVLKLFICFLFSLILSFSLG